MKRHLPFRFIATLGIFCQLSAGLFDNLSTLLEQFSASLLSVRTALPAHTRSDSFAIPKFDKSAIIAIGSPADFSGIPVTQLKVLNQAATGGDASCGYQALKNVAILMSGIIAGKSGSAISQELQDKKIADLLFRKASDNPPAEPGEWRNEFLKKNVMKNLIGAYIKIQTSSVIQTKALQEKLGRLPTPQEEIHEKDILTDLDNELTEVRAVIRKEIISAYEKYLKDPSARSSFSQKYTIEDFKKIRPVFGYAPEYVNPKFSTEISIDFKSPYALGLIFNDFREQEINNTLKSFYAQLTEKTGDSQKDADKAYKKKIVDDFVAQLKQQGRKFSSDDSRLLYAISTKSKELGGIYEKIDREIPQSIDTSGDWLNENQIESLIPAAKKRFYLSNASIIPLEDTNTTEGKDTIKKIAATLRSNESSIVGVVLGAQDSQNPTRSSGHWIGLVMTKIEKKYHIFVMDSLNNTNRLITAPVGIPPENPQGFGDEEDMEKILEAFAQVFPEPIDVSTEIFNERIKKITQAIASAEAHSAHA